MFYMFWPNWPSSSCNTLFFHLTVFYNPLANVYIQFLKLIIMWCCKESEALSVIRILKVKIETNYMHLG